MLYDKNQRWTKVTKMHGEKKNSHLHCEVDWLPGSKLIEKKKTRKINVKYEKKKWKKHKNIHTVNYTFLCPSSEYLSYTFKRIRNPK